MGRRRRFAVGVAAVLLLPICAAAYANRPRRSALPEVARTGLYAPEPDSMAMRAARMLAISSVTAGSRFLIEVLNDFKVVDPGGENHAELMRLVRLGREGRGGRALITVSNHTSVIDDPVLQSSVVGFLPPDLHRWGVCKEHICFGNDLLAAFTGAGKVLPVVVGDGVEQTQFKAVARKVAHGDWVHIYPEAACIQSGTLGRGQRMGCRDPAKAEQVGLLKWGVGKLVAHCAFSPDRAPPIIVPYYHVGMDELKPFDREVEVDNRHKDPWYVLSRTNKKIRVWVGKPIDVSDLLAEYEAKVGHPRRTVRINPQTQALENWDGSEELERELYSNITRRVERVLLELERDIQAATTTTPRIQS